MINKFKALMLPVLALMIGLSVSAQQTRKQIDEALTNKAMAADTSKKGPWKMGGTAVININQQNSSYWVGVTEKYAFNLGGGLDLYANYAEGKSSWDNTLKAAYSYLNNQSQGVRKTGDFFDLFSKYGHSLNKANTLKLSALYNLRSQFTNGYDYAQTPRRRTSGFFAPANMLLTPGIDWKPKPFFSLFFSPLAAKWVIVSNDPYSYSVPGGILPGGGRQQPISLLYGVDPEKKVDAQFGAFLSANFNKELVKNVSYTSRLDLYSNYLRQPQNIDIFWTNALLFKVNKWLAINYQWNIAYDNDFVPEGLKGPRPQFLGTLGIGVTAKF